MEPENRKPVDPIGDAAHWLFRVFPGILRRNLLLILFGVLIYFQYMTWQAVEKIYIPSNCGESEYHPCHPTAYEIAKAIGERLNR